MTTRYLEDFTVGQRFSTGRHMVDDNQIKMFAAEFDPQPFHIDAAAAKQSIFRGLAASGWHHHEPARHARKGPTAEND